MADPAIWLDITRTLSRVGRHPPTGIDRVEMAYIKGLIRRENPLFGFARVASGYALLDIDGLRGCLDRLEGACEWGGPDLAGYMSRRLPPDRRRAESDVRRLAVATCLRSSLPRFLRRHLAPGTRYLNVGHSNLTHKVLGGLAEAEAKICVYLHDTIPIDWPGDHRPETVASFRNRIGAVRAFAHDVLCPSASAAQDIARHTGLDPTVAPPGVSLAPADPSELPIDAFENRPYFVTIGTIDGRKNQEFLLDLWAELGPVAPALYLVGTRGTCGLTLISKLDAPPPHVRELPGLSDGAVAALLTGAAGLLHPSKAEGYGFTLLEAGLHGVPVLANDLPVYRETLGDIGVYVPLDDLYQWKATIKEWADQYRHPTEQHATRKPTRPDWDTHLNVVLSRL